MSLVRSPARSIFFPRTDDSHFHRIHSSLTTVLCFDNGWKAASGLERILCGVLVKRTLSTIQSIFLNKRNLNISIPFSTMYGIE